MSYIVPLCLCLGAHRRKGTTNVQQNLKVKAIHTHSGFSMKHLNHDIAVLQLERPVELSDKVATVCLPNKLPDLNAKCYITGAFCFIITSNMNYKNERSVAPGATIFSMTNVELPYSIFSL